jgi:hypothetical protein
VERLRTKKMEKSMTQRIKNRKFPCQLIPLTKKLKVQSLSLPLFLFFPFPLFYLLTCFFDLHITEDRERQKEIQMMKGGNFLMDFNSAPDSCTTGNT